MEITTIGVIDPTNELLPLLKQHLTRNFKFAYASDFTNAAEIFESPVLVIIHWPCIETGDLPAITRLREFFPNVHFILFARPMKNELGFSLGKKGYYELRVSQSGLYELIAYDGDREKHDYDSMPTSGHKRHDFDFAMVPH